MNLHLKTEENSGVISHSAAIFGTFNNDIWYTDLIKNIQNEAKKLNINCLQHFGFREFYINGRTAGFSSNEHWNKMVDNLSFRDEMMNHYFNELVTVSHQAARYVVRNKGNVNNYFLQSLVEVDMANSLVLYRREAGVIKGYYFIAYPLDYQALSLFVNNLPLFERLADIITPLIEKNQVYRRVAANPIQLFSANQVAKIFHKNDIYGQKIIFKSAGYQFTFREVEILKLLDKGFSIKGTAIKLNISPKTVEWHLQNIKEKFGKTSKNAVIECFRQVKVS